MKELKNLKNCQIPAKRQKSVCGGRNFIIIEDELLLRTLNPYIIIEDVVL